RLELVEPTAGVDRLEQRAAADDRCLQRTVERDLLLEVVRDVRGAPAELDDVHVGSGGIEEALDLAQVEPLVDHVRQALETTLPGSWWEVEESVKAVHRSPPVVSAQLPVRRGRARCRASRCRP